MSPLDAIEAHVATAFGYTPVEAVGLLPRPGVCVDLRTCYRRAKKGSLYCGRHGGGR